MGNTIFLVKFSVGTELLLESITYERAQLC